MNQTIFRLYITICEVELASNSIDQHTFERCELLYSLAKRFVEKLELENKDHLFGLNEIAYDQIYFFNHKLNQIECMLNNHSSQYLMYNLDQSFNGKDVNIEDTLNHKEITLSNKMSIIL